MKRTTGNLITIILIMVGVLSCGKDDSNESKITLSKLVGNWRTVTFKIGGAEYSCFDLDASGDPALSFARYCVISFEIESANEAIIADQCNSIQLQSDEVVVSGDQLIFKNNGAMVLTYKVLSYENNILKLELLSENIAEPVIIGSELNMEKW